MRWGLQNCKIHNIKIVYKILCCGYSLDSSCKTIMFTQHRFWNKTVRFRIPSLSSGNPFPNKPWLLCVCSTSLLKTLWEKEKLLMMSNFSFSHGVSYPIGELSAIVVKSWNYCLQSLSVWKSLKFAFWERINWSSETVYTRLCLASILYALTFSF